MYLNEFTRQADNLQMHADAQIHAKQADAQIHLDLNGWLASYTALAIAIIMQNALVIAIVMQKNNRVLSSHPM